MQGNTEFLAAMTQKTKQSKPIQNIICSCSRLGSCLFSLPFSNWFSIDAQRHLVQLLIVLKYLAIGKTSPSVQDDGPQKLCKIPELRDCRGCYEFSGWRPSTLASALRVQKVFHSYPSLTWKQFNQPDYWITGSAKTLWTYVVKT